MTRGERTPAEAKVECCVESCPILDRYIHNNNYDDSNNMYPYMYVYIYVYSVSLSLFIVFFFVFIYWWIANFLCCHSVELVRHKADCGPGLGCDPKPWVGSLKSLFSPLGLQGKQNHMMNGLCGLLLARSGAAQPDPLLIFLDSCLIPVFPSW